MQEALRSFERSALFSGSSPPRSFGPRSGRDPTLAGSGGPPTLAELATACMLAYVDLRLPECDWRPGAPALAALSARMEQRASFAATRPATQVVPVQA